VAVNQLMAIDVNQKSDEFEIGDTSERGLTLAALGISLEGIGNSLGSSNVGGGQTGRQR
jgi:hypothetical protein